MSVNNYLYMSYSLDFRKRVFKTKKEKGLTFEQVSERFGVSMRSLFRWKDRIEPILKRNKPATKIDMKKLEEDVKKYPDLYLAERAEKFGVSKSCVFFALQRLGISNKKNSISSEGR